MRAFPFLGHGVHTAKSAKLFLVAGPEVASRFPTARCEGPAMCITLANVPPKLGEELAQLPLSLAVWPGRVRGSDWHRESLHDERIFTVLSAVVRAAPLYLAERVPTGFGSRADVSDILYDALEGHAPRAELVRATLECLIAHAPGRSRVVLTDWLLERLPSLLGFDFEADLVVRHVLARLQNLSPNSLEASPQFQKAMAERIRARHKRASWHPGKGGPDWANVSAITAAIEAKSWDALGKSLDESQPAHVQTLLELTAAQLVALAKGTSVLALRIANAAAMMLPEGNFTDAMQLYDGALEGQLPPMACANPLYAVQDDNHHLGVEVERARHYLERCLPHGVKNPAIFLNAALVFMELDEPARALEMLALAKKHGMKVQEARNERLFVPLQGAPEFIALMKR